MCASNWCTQSLTHFLLFCVCQLSYNNGALGAVKPIETLAPFIPKCWWIWVLGQYTNQKQYLQHPNKLIYDRVAISAGIITCLNKMCNMLLWVALPIKLAEPRRLITIGHIESINPLSVRQANRKRPMGKELIQTWERCEGKLIEKNQGEKRACCYRRLGC